MRLSLKAAATLCLLAFALVGCGKKGMLIPPEALVPAPIDDLRVNQKGELFQVSWSAPGRDEGGARLKDLAGFILLRHEILPPQNECDLCPSAYRVIARVDTDYLKEVRRLGNRFLAFDREITVGKSYRYKVLSYKTDGTQSKDSNKVEATDYLPPPPPSLSAVSSSTGIALSFSSPPPKEGTMIGYNIYRRGETEPRALVPLNAVPVTVSPYLEPLVQRGVRHFYSATVVVKIGNDTVESAPSAEAAGSLLEPD